MNDKRQTRLSVYNAAGRMVRQWNRKTIKLSNNVVWDGTDDRGKPLAPGVYFCILQQDGYTASVKLIKTK